MSGSTSYELYSSSLTSDEGPLGEFPWEEPQRPAPSAAFSIREEDGIAWINDNGEGELERVDRAESAAFGLCVVRRRLSFDLALVTRGDGVLVNGLPALRMSLLGTKDSLRLGPGRMFYVTQRVQPYMGRPVDELVGRKCAYCKLQADESTSVVSCNCGAVYHHETSDSHPDLPQDDRLNCFAKLENCLSCSRTLTTNEYLVWEPEL